MRAALSDSSLQSSVDRSCRDYVSRTRGHTICLGIVTVLLVLAGVALFSGPANAAPTEIDSCTTIDEPGRYVLTADIQESDAKTCIDIRADNVILDGAGYTIDGRDQRTEADPRSGDKFVGVRARSATNVTVSNVQVTDWQAGVSYEQVTNGRITDVTARSNVAGIQLGGSRGSTVADSTAVGGRFGIYLFELDGVTADGNRLIENTVRANTLGIDLEGANDNVARGNTARNSGEYGIALLFPENYNNTFVNDVVIGATEDGLCVMNSNGNRFVNTTVRDSGRFEYFASNGSTSNRVENLQLTSATVSFRTGNVALDAVENPPESPDDRRAIGQYVTMNATEDGEFAFLNVSYTDETVREANVEEDSLRLYQNDDGEWAEVTGTNGVNAAEDYVFANVTDPVPNRSIVVAPLGAQSAGASADANETAGTSAERTAVEETTSDGTATASASSTDASTTSDESTATTTGTTASGDGEQTTGATGPGFGVLVAVIALLAGALLTVRHR